jgi:hypothetical protein
LRPRKRCAAPTAGGDRRQGNLSELIGLLPLALTVLLLIACSAAEVKLTPGHVDSLTSRFVGRQFVFRTDWHQGMLVYKGQPVNNKLATFYNETPGVIRGRQQRGPLVARAGDVATITKVEPAACCILALYFTTQRGAKSYVAISTPNKQSWGTEFYEDLTDRIATDAWVEQQLAQETVNFLQPAARTANKDSIKLPDPPKQLVLTRPDGKIPSEPVVSALAIKAEPLRVKRGAVLNLTLDYTIDAPGESQVEVSESLTLLLNGKPLPSYPRERTERRVAGNHTTFFRQKIPSRAADGGYTYKGEVCIPSGCTSRVLTFSVVP